MSATRAATAADATTWRPLADVLPPPSTRALLLTVVYHPELRRIGETARLRGVDEDRTCQLSRTRPEFVGAAGTGSGLADPYLSRTPLLLVPAPDGGVVLHGPGLAVMVDGRPLDGSCALGPDELADGVVLALAGRVVLLLHIEPELERIVLPGHDLVGEAAALHAVRAEVRSVADLALPVLLRGESGTGKQQVARALHAASSRAAKPFVALSLAALNPQTAVAELLGHRRGSFTGATSSRDGYFREADGGTLFLDEIGDAPLDVQGALLRVIETGDLQPVGGGGVKVDVRIVASTGADLEAAVLAGRFRLALLHRLAGYEIWLPPLRARRADIARLLMHLIHLEARRTAPDQDGRLFERDPIARLPPSLMAALVRHDWPGNVRQLHNVARQLVVQALAGRPPRSSAAIERLLAATPPPTLTPTLASTAGVRRPPAARVEIEAAVLSAVLEKNCWKIDATARELGISKTSLYAQIARAPGLHKAGDISRGELLRCRGRHAGDLPRMAEELRISVRALQLRMRALGLPAASGEGA